jgi:hypothetical protein
MTAMVTSEHFLKPDLPGAETKPLEQAPVRVVNVVGPNSENHFLNLIVCGEKIPRRVNYNVRGFFNRVAVNATTDCGKRYCFDLIFYGKL